MVNEEVYKSFRKAVDLVNNYSKPLPADLLLKIYAYYKIANENSDNPGSTTPLINAFKTNALIQAKDVDRQEAMKEYVLLVEKEISKTN